jgi:phage-related protein
MFVLFGRAEVVAGNVTTSTAAASSVRVDGAELPPRQIKSSRMWWDFDDDGGKSASTYRWEVGDCSCDDDDDDQALLEIADRTDDSTDSCQPNLDWFVQKRYR